MTWQDANGSFALNVVTCTDPHQVVRVAASSQCVDLTDTSSVRAATDGLVDLHTREGQERHVAGQD